MIAQVLHHCLSPSATSLPSEQSKARVGLQSKRELALQVIGCVVARYDMWLNANDLSVSLRGVASETAEECVIKAQNMIYKATCGKNKMLANTVLNCQSRPV